MAAAARRPSTLRTYDSRLARFGEWCAEKAVAPRTASLARVSEFLMALFNEGKQVNTIKNYRSAIAAVHGGFPDGTSVSSSQVIQQLLKGMANTRPVVRALAPSWSINGVLRSLAAEPFEPLHSAPLELLTRKTLFLVAVATARRRSCLQALSVKPGHIRFEHHGVRLVPDPAFIAKNQTLDFLPGDLFIPEIASASSVREDRKWCPVRALKWYLHRTKGIRASDRLFVLPRRPHSAASRDTISRWLSEVISPHAAERVRAHEVRGQAASRALFAGVPIEDILRAAAWKTPSSFVACYLSDTLAAEAAFGRAALGAPLGGPPSASSSVPH